jgi:hypothetical protein
MFQTANPPNAGLCFEVRANLARISERVIRRVADGRGRDEDCSSPPAQIPASATNAPGSSFGSDVVR